MWEKIWPLTAYFCLSKKILESSSNEDKMEPLLNLSLSSSNGQNISSTQEPRQSDPTENVEFKATKVFFYMFILICSTLGNIAVVWIICSSKKMRKSSNFLILNLSICDLVTPVISIPFDFALEERGYSWFYGKTMCKFIWPCATLTTTSSSLILAAISFDRYRFLMHPFKTKLSWKQIQMIAVLSHIMSLLCVLPYIYVLELRGDNCVENWPDGFPFRKGYTLLLFLVQYAIPLVFMVVMYALAISNLRVSSHRVRKWTNEDIDISNVKRGENLHWLKSPNAKATRMFVVVVVVFAVFMFPNQVLWLWLDIGENESSPNLPTVKVICWLFTYTNSVGNPLIYFKFNRDFSKGLKRLAMCLACRTRRRVFERAQFISPPDSGTSETNESLLRKMSISLLRKSFSIRKKWNSQNRWWIKIDQYKCLSEIKC